jgi:hypothetical protein
MAALPSRVRRVVEVAVLVAATGCSSPPDVSPKPEGMTLDGTYAGTTGRGSEELTFSNDTHAYSVSIVGFDDTPFTETGTFDFTDSIVTLRSATGAITQLRLDVLAQEPHASGALRPQDSLVAITGQQLVGDPNATNFKVSACNGGVSITYTSGTGQSCALFLSNATFKLK